MSEDPYYYPGTDVLKNLKNIRDKKDLERFETGSAQLRTIAAEKLTGPFDINRLNATHQTLFGKVYEWAGKFRENTGTMTKGREAGYNVTYGNSTHVPAQLAIVFAELKKENYLKDLPLEQFAKRLAHVYGELDSIHAYRDGNSRTLRLFTTDLAKEAGHKLDWNRTLQTDADRNKLFHARDLAVMRADSSELASVVLTCLTERAQERNVPSPAAEETTMPDLEVANNSQPIPPRQSTQEQSGITYGPETYEAQYLTRSDHLVISEIESDEWVDIAGGDQQLRVQTGKDDAGKFHARVESIVQGASSSEAKWSLQELDTREEALNEGRLDIHHAQEMERRALEDHYAEQARNGVAEDREGDKQNLQTATPPNSKEPIAVRLTEEQTKLLLSAEYPNNSQQQTTALYNVYNGIEKVDVMNESVALDYSEDLKSFYASLDRDEKPALDAKLTQLQAEKRRVNAPAEKKPQERQKQRSRDIERD